MTCAATTTGHALPPRSSRRSHATALYQIGPFKVSFRSDLDEIMEDVDHLYRHCRLSPTEVDSTHDVITMEVRRHLFSLPFLRRYMIYGDGEPLFSPRRRDEVLPYLEWGVNWRIIESRREHLQLHAATVSWRGRGVILAANSGSGKSTLTAGMLTRGWKYFSDEFALIDPRTHMLHAYPKALCMKAGSFDAVRALGLPLYTRRHYVKAFKGRVAYISLADLPDDVVSPPCPVRYVIFPHYTGTATPTMTPMSRAEAAMEMAMMSFNRHKHGCAGIDVIGQVLRDAQCFRLESGNLMDTCALVESVCPA